jgi:hypothetical protein
MFARISKLGGVGLTYLVMMGRVHRICPTKPIQAPGRTAARDTAGRGFVVRSFRRRLRFDPQFPSQENPAEPLLISGVVLDLISSLCSL